MARCLTSSPHSRATCALLFTSFRGCNSFQWGISRTPRRSISRPKLVPLLRLCSESTTPQNPVDMSKYADAFAKRMAMAGLGPHHRVALGVSGGPDSVALCVLAANWKDEAIQNNGVIDGLLAIIVDHGLRPESRDEALLVSRRLFEMGIRCEIAHCEWPGGKPNQGHLQQAARDMRYRKFQEICVKNGINVLLVAHHADDQAELFILRLSRNSGVLGLAGMAFSSQLFSSSLHHFGESYVNHDIFLVRPLLDLSKEDMYKICQGAGREWVEDPTNQSQLYARNRIRKSLGNSSTIFDYELQAVINACRDTRIYVDLICKDLINKAVTVMPHGYAVIDLELLNPSNVVEICLSKFLALVLQFVSQRQKPVRGSASKLLLDYIRTLPCQTSLTAAGCYLCAAPGSKGTKVLVCCSVNHLFSPKLESVYEHSDGELKQKSEDVLKKIVADGKLSLNHSVPDAANIRFLDVPSDQVLLEARKLDILSETTYKKVLFLQNDEIEKFKFKDESSSDVKLKQEGEFKSASDVERIHSGKLYYFMKRFLIKYEWSSAFINDLSCVIGHDMDVYVRLMIDTDWLYLAELSKTRYREELPAGVVLSNHDAMNSTEMVKAALDNAKLSAQRSLQRLKKIPVAARRGLPVLIDSKNKLLAIPGIGFNHCHCLSVDAEFMPRIPLGGGHSSFSY